MIDIPIIFKVKNLSNIELKLKLTTSPKRLQEHILVPA